MARPRRIGDAAILDAARRVFTAGGMQATTRMVAEAAGVSQATLFQRYGTKQRLFFAALLPPPPSLSSVLGVLPAAGAKAARVHLSEIAARLLSWLDAALPATLRAALHPDYPSAVGRAHAPNGEAAIAAALALRLAELQQRGDLHAGIDPARAAEGLLLLLHGDALAGLVGGAPCAVRDRGGAAVEGLWEGLAPGRRGRRTTPFG